MTTFTDELIQKSFEATGIFPANANVILNRFETEKPTTPPEQVIQVTESGEPTWLKAKSLVRSSVKDINSAEAQELVQHLHSLHVEKELLEHQLDGVKEALTRKKKLRNKQKVLPLYAHNLDWNGGAKWWSPSSKKEAEARQQAYEVYAAEQEAEKATERELKKTEKLLKKKRDEQARVRRAREKKERDERRAEERKAIDKRKAERARKKQERDAQKAIQMPTKGKRKASTAAEPATKRSRSAGVALRAPTVHEPSSAPAPTLNSRGRKILQPRKFW